MKPTAARWMLALALGAAVAAGMGGLQSSQPGKPPAREQGGTEPRQEMPSDPAQAKKYLERRLEETTKREEHLKSLLTRLEKGESPTDVGKDLEPGRGRDTARRSGDQGDQRGPRGDRPQRGKITPEDREHVLTFLRENSPELAARFDKLIKSDPEMADRIMGHMVGRIRDAEQVRETNVGLFKLRVQEMEGGAVLVDAMKAFREAKSATPQDPAKLSLATQQLRMALARQLDLRLSLQENEIEGLTRRLSDLKSDLEKKRSGRDEAIDSMLSKVKDGKDMRERDGERRPESHPTAPGPGTPPG